MYDVFSEIIVNLKQQSTKPEANIYHHTLCKRHYTYVQYAYTVLLVFIFCYILHVRTYIEERHVIHFHSYVLVHIC